MKELPIYLKKKGYYSITFKISKTNHLLINAQINGTKGVFILDTGASNTCVNIFEESFFAIASENSDTKASGAGSNELETKTSANNHIKLGYWIHTKLDLILIDLSHVNQALASYKTKKIHGIIGADILKLAGGIIDYNSQKLYLKKGLNI